MQKQITSIFLVAGTCIGGGMLALPMVLAKLGIATSMIIMIFTWLLTYYSSLISVELNLNSDKGISLGLMGRKFSGKKAEILGEISVKLLCYALLSAFICGASSIIQRLIEECTHYQCSIISVETYLSLVTIVVLLFPIKVISKLNNMAFSCFLTIFAVLIAATLGSVDFSQIPWFTNIEVKDAANVITVVFTSFGYQVIFHTLRDYCGRDAKILRKAFFLGSLIPTIVYMIWTGSALSVIYKTNHDFFNMITNNQVDVGGLVGELAKVSGLPGFQSLTWIMAIFAIVTSILGVGIGLAESLNLSLDNSIPNGNIRRFVSAAATVLPAYVVAAVMPNAFTKILGFAGAILVVIAIFLPAYLIKKAKIEKLYLPELKWWLIVVCCIMGLLIIASEFFANHL